LDPANPVVTDVRDRGVGSVVLFSRDMVLDSPVRNVASPGQLQALDAALQALAASASAAIPLMIAIDQEGGRVARLDEQRGFPPTHSAQVLGEIGDLAYTYAQAEQMARTLAAAGINHNLAPAVDLNSNPDSPAIGRLGRSFSADPAVVIDHARAFIVAHRAHKITTTIKHFPGHGSARADSHKGFVDVTDSWQELELEPYRALIAEGAVDAVMSAHVFNARLDPVYPATLSPAILTGLLREQLGFKGVIMTDDMGMKAIAAQYGFAEAVVQAVQAGVDMLTFGNNLEYNPDVVAHAIAILTQAVADGAISEQRIDASYERILALKAKWK
jgi:beta-N-acetylhexosaminidase